MSHKTKVAGAVANIVGGKTKINGAVYSITKGMTKFNGEVREILFEAGYYLEPIYWTDRTGVSYSANNGKLEASGGNGTEWGGVGYILCKDGAPYPVPRGSTIGYSYDIDFRSSSVCKAGLYLFYDMEDLFENSYESDTLSNREGATYIVNTGRLYAVFLVAVGGANTADMWSDMTLRNVTVDGNPVRYEDNNGFFE